MKTVISFFVFSTLFMSTMYGQRLQERGIFGVNNWTKGWAESRPNKIEYPEATKTIPYKIDKDYTLTNANTYSLESKVYVTNGATLTIQEGTIIRCDKASGAALIITKGSKIKAEGTALNPIVFTSNQPANGRKTGDWSGIMILGDAPLNTLAPTANVGYDTDGVLGQYGGSNIESNSGVMKYVRIEFAGQKTEVSKKEQNALTLAGVGSKTVIDFVQTSFSQDDGFEFLGGGLTLNNLISYKSKDDDFDFNLGAQVTINNSQAIRNPLFNNIAAPRAVEIDNYEGNKSNLDATKKQTNVTLVHCTIINEGAESESVKSLLKEAIYVNEMCDVTIKRTVIQGFKNAIYFSKAIDPKAANLAKINIEMLWLIMCDGEIASELGSNYNSDILTYYSQPKFQNLLEDKAASSELFKDVKNVSMPDYRIKVDGIK